MLNNLLLLTDSYKTSHATQYEKGTTSVYSYFESRGGLSYKVVFFGLQYLLKHYLEGQVVTRSKIDQAEKLINQHMGPGIFNRRGWEYILEEHDGKLPIIIKAVNEGSLVETSNVLMTVENTDPQCYWLTNYLETLLVQTWYPSTVATVSHLMKQKLLASLNLSGDPSLIDFKLHDFGCRGVSSMETAALGGAAHLLNFKGTDTMPALELLMQYYGTEMPGFSIPAAEHSTITSWGKDREVEAFANMLNQYPKGLVAVVSDSYDVMKAVDWLWGVELKDQVLARDGTLVIRPDSGDPVTLLPTLLKLAGENFGYTVNDKGYKVLNPKVRFIWGDGIDLNSLGDILLAINKAAWSTDNIAFGSGGGLLQKWNRDTFKFAFKCSAVTVNGETRDVYKQPIDAPWKTSKKGKMKLIKTNNKYFTVDQSTDGENHLNTVFVNGMLTNYQTLEQIRQNLENHS